MLFSLPFQENGLLVFNQVSIEVDLDLGLHVRYSLLRSGLTQLQQLNLLVELDSFRQFPKFPRCI